MSKVLRIGGIVIAVWLTIVVVVNMLQFAAQ